MPDLRITHLTFRKTHSVPAGLESRMGHLREETIQDGRTRSRDGVSLPFFSQAVAVEDGEKDGKIAV